MPPGGLGLASLGHFVCGPHRPGVPRESALPPLCVAHPLGVGDFVGSRRVAKGLSKDTILRGKILFLFLNCCYYCYATFVLSAVTGVATTVIAIILATGTIAALVAATVTVTGLSLRRAEKQEYEGCAIQPVNNHVTDQF